MNAIYRRSGAIAVAVATTMVGITPVANSDESSGNRNFSSQGGGSTITVIGDQYERLDPAAGAGSGSSGGSGSGSSGGSSDVVVSFSVSKPGRVPLVCVAYAPDPGHLFCRPYEPEEPEEPAPAVVPVVVAALRGPSAVVPVAAVDWWVPVPLQVAAIRRRRRSVATTTSCASTALKSSPRGILGVALAARISSSLCRVTRARIGDPLAA